MAIRFKVISLRSSNFFFKKNRCLALISIPQLYPFPFVDLLCGVLRLVWRDVVWFASGVECVCVYVNMMCSKWGVCVCVCVCAASVVSVFSCVWVCMSVKSGGVGRVTFSSCSWVFSILMQRCFQYYKASMVCRFITVISSYYWVTITRLTDPTKVTGTILACVPPHHLGNINSFPYHLLCKHQWARSQANLEHLKA